MRLNQLPAQSRPREKLLSQGVQALSDAELLAIFLRTGVAGCSALQLADDLIRHFGGLRAVLDAPREAICAIKGLGSSKYAQLRAVRALAERSYDEALQRDGVIRCANEVKQLVRARLQGEQREVFAVLFLDNQHAVLQFEALFFGSINGANIHPRIVVQKALAYNAAALIVCHNHPSGIAEPSAADLSITRQLVNALALMEIRLLDHLIVAGPHVVSLAERGEMPSGDFA